MRILQRLAMASAVGVTALGEIAPGALAGSLAPPAGPIGPTMKTLDEVEPRIPISLATTPGDADSVFRIEASGSYYLVSNVAGTAAKNGIEIGAPFVTIDCNGFALIGPSNALAAITVTGPFQGVTIHNGNIRGWSAGGIDLSQGSDHFVSDFMLEEIGGDGIKVGLSSIVTGITAELTSFDGIETGADSLVINCVIRDAGGVGILIGQGSSIWSCNVFGSVDDGVKVGRGSSVTLCYVVGSDQTGIETGEACVVEDCIVSGTLAGGVTLFEGSSLRGSLIMGSRLNGVLALNGCTVERVLVQDATPTGISLFTDGLLTESLVIAGSIDPQALVTASSGSLISRNLLVRGGAAPAVQLTESGNALVDNHATKMDVGYDLTTFPVTRCLLVGNSAFGVTTGFSLNPVNAFGSIVNVTSGTTTLSAGRWHNFEWN